eukprot:5144403-Heterocapsa_arctica.AAC.1
MPPRGQCPGRDTGRQGRHHVSPRTKTATAPKNGNGPGVKENLQDGQRPKRCERGRAKAERTCQAVRGLDRTLARAEEQRGSGPHATGLTKRSG